MSLLVTGSKMRPSSHDLILEILDPEHVGILDVYVHLELHRRL
jgi:hypothetical protein